MVCFTKHSVAGFNCDVPQCSNKKLAAGSAMQGCRDCNYNLCEDCAAGINNSGSGAAGSGSGSSKSSGDGDGDGDGGGGGGEFTQPRHYEYPRSGASGFKGTLEDICRRYWAAAYLLYNFSKPPPSQNGSGDDGAAGAGAGAGKKPRKPGKPWKYLTSSSEYTEAYLRGRPSDCAVLVTGRLVCISR